jgi:tRNA(adenine34) deaminase
MNTFEMDQFFMRMAIRQALMASDAGEVPIGAVIIRGGELLGQAHNQVELLKDPTAHAEVLAITQAANAMDDWRLTDTTLYVTKEPCPMCAGAIVNARITRVVWGVDDPKRGGAKSKFDILSSADLNHQPQFESGIEEDTCRELLQSFFKQLRK